MLDTMDTVVRMQFGSQLYGTSTPMSDVDFKAVHVPAAKDIILQRTSKSIQTGPSKQVDEKNQPGDVDEENYSLQYFLKLLAEGQTGAIDMLFAPDSALLYTTDLWQTIRENKDRLLTKKAAAFVGYCKTQANKYGIKGSRMAAAKAVVDFFQTEIACGHAHHYVGDYGYILATLFGDKGHIEIITKETTQGRFETYFGCCGRMVGFKNTVKEAAGIYSRIYENYGERARKALNNEGIDWKALSHAVRVGTEAVSLLDTGQIEFPLYNAKHLVDIKLGRLTYAEVAEEIEVLLSAVEAASERSTLREKADKKFIDDLVEVAHVSKIERYVNGERVKAYAPYPDWNPDDWKPAGNGLSFPDGFRESGIDGLGGKDDWGGINPLGGGSIAE